MQNLKQITRISARNVNARELYYESPACVCVLAVLRAEAALLWPAGQRDDVVEEGGKERPPRPHGGQLRQHLLAAAAGDVRWASTAPSLERPWGAHQHHGHDFYSYYCCYHTWRLRSRAPREPVVKYCCWRPVSGASATDFSFCKKAKTMRREIGGFDRKTKGFLRGAEERRIPACE